MAFKTFAPGVLTSSDVNTFLMKQSVITCTAATRPASPNEGMLIYETDTNIGLQYDGSAWVGVSEIGDWTVYTPIISGGAWALGNGTITGHFRKVSNTVFMRATLLFGSTTAKDATLALAISTPTAVKSASIDSSVAMATAFDASVATSYLLVPLVGATSVNMYAIQSSAGLSEAVISSKPFTWTTNDRINLAAVYEEA